MARVGTLDWADATGGKLRWRDRLELLARQAPPELARQGIEFFFRLPRPLDVEALRPIFEDLDGQIPTTKMARQAEELCRRAAPEWLVDHCFRVYAFGLMLGTALGDPVREKLFAMAMLHDLGLTEEYRRQPGGQFEAPCFAVRGAQAARAVAGDEVAEAVALHLNVRVPRRSHGLEAHLVQAATNLDVAGVRSRRLPDGAIEKVNARWPRGSWRWEAWRALHGEAEAQPEYCRARFLARWGMLRWRISRARFPG